MDALDRLCDESSHRVTRLVGLEYARLVIKARWVFIRGHLLLRGLRKR